MSDVEYRVLREVLDAPALWAFAIVAGEVGLDRAAEAARTRSLPEDLRVRLASVGYGVEHLPLPEAVEDLREGIRVEAAWRAKRGGAMSLPVIAKSLGLDPVRARRAWQRLREFGWLPGTVKRQGRGWR